MKVGRHPAEVGARRECADGADRDSAAGRGDHATVAETDRDVAGPAADAGVPDCDGAETCSRSGSASYAVASAVVTGEVGPGSIRRPPTGSSDSAMGAGGVFRQAVARAGRLTLYPAAQAIGSSGIRAPTSTCSMLRVDTYCHPKGIPAVTTRSTHPAPRWIQA
jgi:hypothetical protein